MMAFFWQGALVLSLAVAILVNADMRMDCGSDFVSVVWTDTQSKIDPSLVRLGNCHPNSFSAGDAFFNVGLDDCSFKRLVTRDQLVFMNDLTYICPKSNTLIFSHPVVCVYERPRDWYPPILDQVVFHTHGVGYLRFHMELMNEDFSGPATSTAFSLGSLIPISASVEQKFHQPLLLFLEECVAASTPQLQDASHTIINSKGTPQLQDASHTYTIINNKGCLVDSKVTRTKFEPRREASVLNLSLQALKFAVGEEVYVHCKLAAWDPNNVDSSKKACHYVKGHGWELLDDPSYSGLCNCCESSCRPRNRRSSASGMHGFSQNAVVGPFTITGMDA